MNSSENLAVLAASGGLNLKPSVFRSASVFRGERPSLAYIACEPTVSDCDIRTAAIQPIDHIASSSLVTGGFRPRPHPTRRLSQAESSPRGVRAARVRQQTGAHDEPVI